MTTTLLVLGFLVLVGLITMAGLAGLIYFSEVGWPWPFSAYGRLLDRIEAKGRAKRARELDS